ncbi:MAG: hypothetical protein AB7O80_05515 [Acetobacteraceae bacterium]
MSRINLPDLGSAAPAAPLLTLSPGAARRYRRTVRISIPTGGQAQQMEILDGTSLHIAFSARTFDAKAGSEPEQATLTSGSDGLVLHLPVARKVSRVRLTSSISGDQVAAFRFDGPVVSDEAVAVATHGANGALLNVTDTQLILRRRRASTDLTLTAGDVASVTIAVDPVQPRVAFSIVGDSEGEVVLPPDTDATGAPIIANSAAWGPRFGAALNAQLARLAANVPALPEPLLVDLIVESDTPCTAAVTSFGLDYALIRTGFADGPAKQVLRFAGGRNDTKAVSITLPPQSTALSATLRLTMPGATAPASVRKAAVAAGDESVASTVTTSVTQGVGIIPGRPAAARMTLSAATVVTGAEIVLGAIETPAEVTATLWDDDNGRPGQHLADSSVATIAMARPAGVPLTFAPSVTVPGGPVWLGVSVRRGRVVLGLVTNDGGLVATGDGAVWSLLASATGQTAAAHLLAPGANGGASVGAGGFVVSINGTPLALTADGSTRSAEFSGLLNALPAPRPSTLSVTIRSSTSGVVTVDPPELRYVPA